MSGRSAIHLLALTAVLAQPWSTYDLRVAVLMVQVYLRNSRHPWMRYAVAVQVQSANASDSEGTPAWFTSLIACRMTYMVQRYMAKPCRSMSGLLRAQLRRRCLRMSLCTASNGHAWSYAMP